MEKSQKIKRKIFIAVSSPEDQAVAQAVQRGATIAGYELLNSDLLTSDAYKASEDVARADVVFIFMSAGGAFVSYVLGVAQAMAKPVVALIESVSGASRDFFPLELEIDEVIIFQHSAAGLKTVVSESDSILRRLRKSPLGIRNPRSARVNAPFFVDWDRLDTPEADNLCRELLSQLGYRKIDWATLTPEFDLVAELPKKDPDGYEYRELWLISIGRPSRSGDLDLLISDPEYLMHRIMRDAPGRRTEREFGPATVLLITLDDERTSNVARLNNRMLKSKRGLGGASVRIRVWNREFMTSLVQQFPQLGYKYFSDQGRSGQAYRKSLDELYTENVSLLNEQAVLIKTVEDERNKRITAERDVIWKDISFAAAHKVGNPIFAIETNLQPLKTRINRGRTAEAMQVMDEIEHSVEKAKDIVEQFKSLARIQRMQLVPVDLLPIIEHSCDRAKNLGVACSIKASQPVVVLGDQNRLGECFDELVANSSHWWKSEDKRIEISVTLPTGQELPAGVDTGRAYCKVLFSDNGLGVALKDKEKIFDAFFTRRDQGTGLGLALVRRIVEGHAGKISELGVPSEGAAFEIFLPLVR